MLADLTHRPLQHNHNPEERKNMPGIQYTVTSLERLYNSRNGNPRWALNTEDGHRFVTEADASISYEISPSLEGKTVTIETEGSYVIGLKGHTP